MAARLAEAGPRDRRATQAGRIVAVNRFYWPDESATSQILTDLAEYLAGQGFEVTVVTSRRRRHDRGPPLPALEERNGVVIRRLRGGRFGDRGLLGRLTDYGVFYLAAFGFLLRSLRAGDVVIAKTDPPMVSVPAAVAARLRGAQLVNWCQDLFPELAASLGVRFLTGRAGATLRRVRNWSLRRARVNVVLDAGMAAHLRGQGIPEERIRVVHNWPDARIRPVASRSNPLRAEWGLQERFVVGYSGNLGRSHAMDAVAELVRRTVDLPDLTWLFVGGGVGFERLRAMVAQERLSSVVFRPHQPRERLSQSLSVPDLHLVSVDPACDGLLVPSKLYGIFAAGRPTVLLGNPQSCPGRLLTGAGVGIVLAADEPDTWRSKLERADRRELARMGEAARTLLDRTFRAEHALAAWHQLLADPAPREEPSPPRPVASVGEVA